MSIINCKYIITVENHTVSIEGLSKHVIIDYSCDIDFTELIIALTEMIDNEDEIVVSHIDLSDVDEKTNLVIETLDKILKSYNESIKRSVDENIDVSLDTPDDLPF